MKDGKNRMELIKMETISEVKNTFKQISDFYFCHSHYQNRMEGGGIFPF